MKFLHNLLYSKRPSSKTLLDIALVLSIIPHLFVAKFFMLIYLMIALVFILKKQKYKFTPYLFMVIGLVVIMLNFFDNYNFSNLSRMSFFLSFLSTLLLYVVSLQKLTGTINIYLKISPILLMLLSFFFFDSITMLLYSITVFFIFTLLYIWSRMDAIFIDVLKKTSQLFLLSLPSVIIMFLVFPRISYDKADFGFKEDTYAVSGYDGEMHVGAKEIRLSDKIIMEVSFEDANISDDSLYFRGSTLSFIDTPEWKKLPSFTPKDTLQWRQNIIKYDITLYPHAQQWVYSLDIPTMMPSHTLRAGDFTLSARKKVYKKQRYEIESSLAYKLTTTNLEPYLEVNATKNQYTKKALNKLISLNATQKEKVKSLVAFFQDQNLSYTLKPQNIDEQNFADTFLFEGKNGYCVHFASAFATGARLLGIPSRVVTGFKPSKGNMMNNYLLVRARDAHAWVELYTQESGWVRYDPTKYASQVLDSLEEQTQLQDEKGVLDTLNLYFMYLKYTIENWILDYNRLKQLDILNNLLSDAIYLLKFFLALLGIFALLFILFLNIQKSSSKDAITLEMQKLLRLLKKKNIIKQDDETMEVFLQKAQKSSGISMRAISKYYHILKYSQNKKGYSIKTLQEEIQNLKKRL